MSPKPADLRVRWSSKERALVYDGSKQTGGLLALFFEQVKLIDAYGMRTGLAARIHRPDVSDERSLAQELEARGYDLSTLRFQIRKKASPGSQEGEKAVRSDVETLDKAPHPR